MTFTSPTKRNLVTIEIRKWRDRMVELKRMNSRGISHSDQELLVLLSTQTYVLILKWDPLFYTFQDQLFRILFPICSSPNYLYICHCICTCTYQLTYGQSASYNQFLAIWQSTFGQSAIVRSALNRLPLKKSEFYSFTLNILLCLK